MNKYFIPEDFYGYGLDVICNCTKEEANGWVDSKYPGSEYIFDSSIFSGADGCFSFVEHAVTGCKYPFIWVREFDWTVSSQAVMTHELQHYCFFVMNRMDITIRTETAHAFIYLYHRMFEKIWEALKPIHVKHNGLDKSKRKQKKK